MSDAAVDNDNDNDNDNDVGIDVGIDDDDDESLQRALSDLEILMAAYPDEVSIRGSAHADLSSLTFPIQFTLRFPSSVAANVNSTSSSTNCSITFELNKGYPAQSSVAVASFHCASSSEKKRMELTLVAVRQASDECFQDQMEGSFTCCSVALQEWSDHQEEFNCDGHDDDGTDLHASAAAAGGQKQQEDELTFQFAWHSGQPIIDRKSTFQAHACYDITQERHVAMALDQLIGTSSKLQRATHNIYAWRIVEENTNGMKIQKHDNEDDGEHGGGSKLAYLLDMRREQNVLIVVSRWYGGIHLGPKRFAHIVNVARDLLADTSPNADNKR